MTARQALLLIAHGSTRYADAARPLWRHVEALRQDMPDTCTEVGLLNGVPSITDALAAMPAIPVHVVPFFMEAGYFTNVAIPKALGADPRVRLCPPIGAASGHGRHYRSPGVHRMRGYWRFTHRGCRSGGRPWLRLRARPRPGDAGACGGLGRAANFRTGCNGVPGRTASAGGRAAHAGGAAGGRNRFFRRRGHACA